MAGTVTTTEIRRAGTVKKVIFAWTSDAAGSVDAVTAGAFDGEVLGLTTIPAGGGSAPTDNYDVTVLDADGHDVLLGAGIDRDTANTEHVARTSLGAIANSPLTLAVRNAGNAKGGTVILRIR